MRIEVYLDQAEQPFTVLTPPDTFRFDTEGVPDGPHVLRFMAVDDDGVRSVRTVSFDVQNGPAIVVHGVVEGDTLSGSVSVLANAYGARTGDEFEPLTMETPAPIPTWAWVLFLMVLAWGAGYLSLELSSHIDTVMPTGSSKTVATGIAGDETAGWAALGAQVYGNNCASCHQPTGTGLSGVFPPLVDNPAVTDTDPVDHINAVIHGVSGKIIDGISYPAPMPPFGTQLSDEEIAAVVNHERTQWGNDASVVTSADVGARR